MDEKKQGNIEVDSKLNDFVKDTELKAIEDAIKISSTRVEAAKKLGFLIATWEHRVFITSVMLQINPFDQFGVNAGKIYTNKYLAEYD